MRQPTLFITHGAGPCFFMDWTMGPPDTWDGHEAFLRGLTDHVPERPKAILVISAHWATPRPSVTSSPAPPLLFDYSGFPPHTYELTWPAPGSPALAARVRALLGDAGIETGEDSQRGFDHGTFVPLKLAFPEADVPTVQLSLRSDMDAQAHLSIGRALAPLRDEGVLIIGSGSSFHNMAMIRTPGPRLAEISGAFDTWLAGAVSADPSERDRLLREWAQAPGARGSHPVGLDEHLLPMHVVAGAAGGDRGRVLFTDTVFGSCLLSAHGFGVGGVAR